MVIVVVDHHHPEKVEDLIAIDQIHRSLRQEEEAEDQKVRLPRETEIELNDAAPVPAHVLDRVQFHDHLLVDKCPSVHLHPLVVTTVLHPHLLLHENNNV